MTKKGHNTKTEQELYEEQEFLRAFSEIKGHESEMAGTKGDLAAVYARLKNVGWTKKHIEFAKSLEDKDIGQVIAEFEQKIRIAKMFGHQLGRQLEMLDKDRTPQEDRAYEEGFATGRRRNSATNPYQPGSKEYQSWQTGFNDGTELANKDLSSAMQGASK